MNNRSYVNGHEKHPHYISNTDLKKLEHSFQDSTLYKSEADVLKALSDPTKLKIYMLLEKANEVAVSDICYILKARQSTISHALSDMKKVGIVECHRCSQLVCYSLVKKPEKQNFWQKILNKYL